MKKCIVCLLSAVLLLSLLSVTALAATTVDEVGIMTAYPVAGENVDFVFSVYGQGCRADSSVNSGGFRNGIRWRNVFTGATLGENDVFQVDTMYEVSVYLVAESGYTFDVNSTQILVNMDETTSYSYVDNSRNKVLVTLMMVAEAVYVNRVAVNGLDAPIAGEMPDYLITPESEDTYRLNPTVSATQQGGVTWYDCTAQTYITVGTKFQADHVYWAEIHLDARDGYTFPLDAVGYVDGRMFSSAGAGESIALVVDFLDGDGKDHTHVPSQWKINPVYHYRTCTACGEMLPEEDHIWSPKYHTVDAKTHAYQCARCKTYDTAYPHNPGAPATETTPQTCKDCGYVLKEALGISETTAPTTEETTAQTQETTEATTEAATEATTEATQGETQPQPTPTTQAAEPADTKNQEADSNLILWILVILGGVLICAGGVLITVKAMKK